MHTVSRKRPTQAVIERTLRAARLSGLTAQSAKHYPDGVVEILFSGTSATNIGKTKNDWD